jgi:hypothetical protein
MRSGVVIYHSNILDLYDGSWVREALDSIEGQTYKDFEVYEVNYGDDDLQLSDGKFFSKKMSNHIEAMNFIITEAFEDGCDVVFNTNLDDISMPRRFEKQVEAIKSGHQLVSCDFRYFGEQNRWMDMSQRGDVGSNLNRGHNVICHPGVAYHSSFWDMRYNEGMLGYEDLDLWQRQHKAGKRFHIVPEYLLSYRIHSKQVTKEYDSHGQKKS